MPLGGRVLKQTQGNPCSHIKSKVVCESIDRVSYETVHIAAGAVSRLGRVKSLTPMHMSSQIMSFVNLLPKQIRKTTSETEGITMPKAALVFHCIGTWYFLSRATQEWT